MGEYIDASTLMDGGSDETSAEALVAYREKLTRLTEDERYAIQSGGGARDDGLRATLSDFRRQREAEWEEERRERRSRRRNNTPPASKRTAVSDDKRGGIDFFTGP